MTRNRSYGRENQAAKTMGSRSTRHRKDYWPASQLGIDEVIFEFVSQGAYVKVTAMHPKTLTEVVAVGAASASEADLKRLALRKLEHVMRRRHEADKKPGYR